MNPYIIIGLLISHIGLFGVGYWKGGEHMKNSIEADQKKAQDTAIVKHQEVAKNDLTSAIKIETTREEKKAVFRGIQLKNENRPSDNLAHLSDESFRLWNDANSSAIKNSSSKPVDSLPATPTANEKR